MPAHQTESPAAANAGQTYQSLCRLPVFRPVALKLLKTLACEDAETRQITRLLRSDPGLSAEVMTLANSALYGGARGVRTIERAVLAVGMERLKSLTLSIALESFVRAMPTSKASQRAWRHSLACAFAAEEFAPAYGQSAESAYMAGLMHDLGRFGLMTAFPGRELGLEPYRDGDAVLDDERGTFGIDHAQAGAYLAQAWGLPQEFSAVAGHHHDGAAAAEISLVGLARTVCLAADALDYVAVPKTVMPTCREIAIGLPANVARVVLAAQCGLRERLEERFRHLDGALAP